MEIKTQNVQGEDFFHLPVLSQELIAELGCDGGGGGHSELILATAPDVRVIGIERGRDAIAAAQKLSADSDRDY